MANRSFEMNEIRGGGGQFISRGNCIRRCTRESFCYTFFFLVEWWSENFKFGLKNKGGRCLKWWSHEQLFEIKFFDYFLPKFCVWLNTLGNYIFIFSSIWWFFCEFIWKFKKFQVKTALRTTLPQLPRYIALIYFVRLYTNCINCLMHSFFLPRWIDS